MLKKTFCWRSAHHLYFDEESPLPFEYTRINPGRWHSEGGAIIYASKTPALCALEVIQETGYKNLSNYFLLKIEIKTDFIDEINDLTGGWVCRDLEAKIIGDKWLESLDSLALSVPSAVSELDRNILINPMHPEFKRKVNLAGLYDWPDVSKLRC